MGNKLYVGNLGFNVDNATLEGLFAAHGTVKDVHIVKDRYTGESRGFGFVEMGNDQEAQAAIEALDGKDLSGRDLKVNEAKPREKRGGNGGGRGGRGRY